jgi:hypothetical protein
MKLDDFDERIPLNPEINPRASQDAAARSRARAVELPELPRTTRRLVTIPPSQQLIAFAVVSVVVVALLVIVLSQPSSPAPLAVPPAPEEQKHSNVFIPKPTLAEPTSAPVATPVPFVPVESAPQTGQGMPAANVQPPEEAPPSPSPAPVEQPTAWATSAPVAVQDFKKPKAAQTCQLIGCLPTSNLAQQAGREQTCHALYWQYGQVAEDDDSVSAEDMAAIRGCLWEGFYR